MFDINKVYEVKEKIKTVKDNEIKSMLLDIAQLMEIAAQEMTQSIKENV